MVRDMSDSLSSSSTDVGFLSNYVHVSCASCMSLYSSSDGSHVPKHNTVYVM